MTDRAVRMRRAACAAAVFLASVATLSGVAYGASFVVRPARDYGCYNACPRPFSVTPVLYLGAGDSGRTFRVVAGQNVYVRLSSVAPGSYLTSDGPLLEFGPATATGYRFFADRSGTARIRLVKRAPCDVRAGVCPVGIPAALIDPSFAVTVIVVR